MRGLGLWPARPQLRAILRNIGLSFSDMGRCLTWLRNALQSGHRRIASSLALKWILMERLRHLWEKRRPGRSLCAHVASWANVLTYGTRSSVGPETYKERCPCAYFGGCSSLLIQPIAFSVFIGSGESQSKHWDVRCPLPPGNASAIGLEHFGHNRYAFLMVPFTRSGTRLQSRHQVGPLTTSCEWHIGSRRSFRKRHGSCRKATLDFNWLMLGAVAARATRVYFGGCSSLLIQPIARLVFIGSGRSQ